MIGLTYMQLRAAERRAERRRLIDRVFLFLLGVATGATIIIAIAVHP